MTPSPPSVPSLNTFGHPTQSLHPVPKSLPPYLPISLSPALTTRRLPHVFCFRSRTCSPPQPVLPVSRITCSPHRIGSYPPFSRHLHLSRFDFLISHEHVPRDARVSQPRLEVLSPCPLLNPSPPSLSESLATLLALCTRLPPLLSLFLACLVLSTHTLPNLFRYTAVLE